MDETRRPDPVNRQLGRAATSDRTIRQLELNSGFDALLAEVLSKADDGATATSRSPRSGRRTRRSIVALTAAGGVLASGGVAAAAYVARAHTGHYGAPGMTENDTSEYLNVDAPDFKSVAKGLTKDYPFAAPYTLDFFIDRAARPSSDGIPQTIQVTGIKGEMATAAFGSWEVAWLRDFDARRRPAAAHDLELMRQIADWPIMAQTNGTTYARQLVAAAARGDRAAIVRDLQVNPLPTPPGSK